MFFAWKVHFTSFDMPWVTDHRSITFLHVTSCDILPHSAIHMLYSNSGAALKVGVNFLNDQGPAFDSTCRARPGSTEWMSSSWRFRNLPVSNMFSPPLFAYWVILFYFKYCRFFTSVEPGWMDRVDSKKWRNVIVGWFDLKMLCLWLARSSCQVVTRSNLEGLAKEPRKAFGPAAENWSQTSDVWYRLMQYVSM